MVKKSAGAFDVQMKTDDTRGKVPRGNTCKGVNRAVLELISSLVANPATASFLDLPCGRGEFMGVIRQRYPEATVRGADLFPAETDPGVVVADLSRPLTIFGAMRFDAITCISGVMEFDNTLQFISSCRELLTDDGRLFLTNDNILTVRDRLSFLLFGRVRRFMLHAPPPQPTWKMVPIQNLARCLADAGLDLEDVHYTSASAKELLFLPLGMLIWPFQQAALASVEKSSRPAAELYPFRSLFCRHYVIVAKRRRSADPANPGPAPRPLAQND